MIWKLSASWPVLICIFPSRHLHWQLPLRFSWVCIRFLMHRLYWYFLPHCFDYNLHSFAQNKRKITFHGPETISWSSQNLFLVTILVLLSLQGYRHASFFVNLKVIILFGLLALLALFYSVVMARHSNRFRVKNLPGLKIFLIAFTWSAVTVVLPLFANAKHIQSEWYTVCFCRAIHLYLCHCITIRYTRHGNWPGLPAWGPCQSHLVKNRLCCFAFAPGNFAGNGYFSLSVKSNGLHSACLLRFNHSYIRLH